MTENDPPRLCAIDASDLWQHEALDFTPWLARHLSDLAGELGLQLEFSCREKTFPGWGRADIVARQSETGAKVIIENQFGESDNDHLVRMLGYSTASEADIVIWVAGCIGRGHRQLLEWLNRGDGIQFYGVEIQGWQIKNVKGYRFQPVVVPTGSAGEGERERLQNQSTGYAYFYRPLVSRLRSAAGIEPMGRGGFRGRYRSFSSGYESDGAMYATALDENGRDKVALRIAGENSRALHSKLERAREGLFAAGKADVLDWPDLNEAVDIYWLGVSKESTAYAELIKSPDATREWMISNLKIVHSIFQPELEAAMAEIVPGRKPND